MPSAGCRRQQKCGRVTFARTKHAHVRALYFGPSLHDDKIHESKVITERISQAPIQRYLNTWPSDLLSEENEIGSSLGLVSFSRVFFALQHSLRVRFYNVDWIILSSRHPPRPSSVRNDIIIDRM